MLDKLEKIKNIKNHPDKTMYFSAVMAMELEPHGIKPILVGGGALEFYTQQQMPSTKRLIGQRSLKKLY